MRCGVAVTFPSFGHPGLAAANCNVSMGKLTPAVRQQIAEAFKNNPCIKAIADHFKCDRKTVRVWVRRASSSRETFKDSTRSGRPRKVQGKQKYKARRMALAGSTAGQIATSLSKSAQQKVGAGAVISSLKSGSDPLLWVPVNRGRVLSKVNHEKREKFCRDSKSKQCGAWVYGDSKFCYLYKDGHGRLRWRWRNLRQQSKVLKAGNPIVLHFYGFVSKGYKSPLYFVPPTPPAGTKARKGREAYASKHFIQLLGKVKRDLQRAGKFGARHPIVLDHARQHTSAVSKAAIGGTQLQLVDGFPPQSWDINIIENVWGVLDGKLSGLGKPLPRSPDGWRRRMQRAWDQISQATIDRLIDAVPQRMADIEQRGGAWLYVKKSKR